MNEFITTLCSCDVELREIAEIASNSGYGVTVRGMIVTVYAPDDGQDPLPWGMTGHDMLAAIKRTHEYYRQ